MSKNRLAHICISPDIMLNFSVAGSEHNFKCVAGVPENSEIANAYYDLDRRCFVLIITHPDFEVVKKDAEIPQLKVMLEKVDK